MLMKFQENAKVLEVEKVVNNHYKISLFSPSIAENAKPGQFIMVRCESGSYDPLLRRPLSIHRIEKDSITLLFRTIGKGTRILSELKKNGTVNLIGPLGNEFSLNTGTKTAILIGGGVGIAPMAALAEDLKGKTEQVITIIGSNTKSDVLCDKEFKEIGSDVYISTDDGSLGRKGRATDVLNDLISKRRSVDNLQIFACGPRPMYRELKKISDKLNLSCQVSLEEWMACGIGACNGCTCNTSNGNKKVCKDGPVFDIKDLQW